MDMMRGQKGYVLPLAMGVAFFTMMVVLIIFSAVKANWWAYWDMRMRFESQLMAEDIIAVVSAEESYEWGDGDSDYSYLLDVWENDDMTNVMKYGGGGDYDFLTYYPKPDTYPDGFEPRNITGAFYLTSDAIDEINHELTLLALVSGQGVTVDELFDTLRDAAAWGDVGADTSQYANRRAYYSFSLGIKYLENVSMAERNSLDFGKFARIGGEAYFKSTYGIFGLYPLSTIGYRWEVYNEDGSLHASADTGSAYPDRLFDSIFLGKLHIYDDYMRFWQLNDRGRATLYVLNDDLYDDMDTSHEASAVSVRVKVCDADNTAPCESWAKSSGLPWYKWCWHGTDSTCYSWQYRLVHPSLLTPAGANVNEGLANKTFPFGYSLGDTDLLDQLFSRTWSEIVRTSKNSPVRRASDDGNYLDLRRLTDGKSAVVAIYTVCADSACTEVHTKMAVVLGECYRGYGCYAESGERVHIYDLNEESSSGDTLLVDFGDDSTIYLTPPCVPAYSYYGSNEPFWTSALSVVGSSGDDFPLCQSGYLLRQHVLWVDDDTNPRNACHINPLACDTDYNPNYAYPWTKYIFDDQDSLDYVSSRLGWETTYDITPKTWHPNWQNMIQYSMNLTLVAGRMAILGNLIPVPATDPGGEPHLYEYDLKADESTMQLGADIPNMVDYPPGHVLGILLSGSDDWDGDALWFVDRTGDADYVFGRSAMYGYRFLPDPDNLLPGNTENKDFVPSYANDLLFYSHAFVYREGWGYLQSYCSSNLFSEVFKKLGLLASYDEGTGMLCSSGGSCYGFCRDRYYLAPKNPVKSKPYYWIMPDPNHMPDIYLTDLRMHK